MVQNSQQLFEKALVCLKDNYKSFHFFDERDVVWTLQTHMFREAETQKLPFQIYDNHKLAFGEQVDLNMDKQTQMFREAETRKLPLKTKRGLYVNLAVLNMDNSADTVIEIKYEPDHHRAGKDISAGKLNPSKVTWNDVKHDIYRVRKFVAQGVTKNGFCIFIDEGSHFSWKPSPEGSKWEDWKGSPYSEARISVLTTRFPQESI